MVVPYGGLRGRGVLKQDPPIVRDLHLSLEDLFHGCTKKIKISRRVRARDERGGNFPSQNPKFWGWACTTRPKKPGIEPKR